MINRIIEYSIRNKVLVIIVTLLVIAGGIYSMINIPLDAIPDLSDVQVIIYSEYPGQAPQVVEDLVTYPITSSMLAVPYTKVVRGYSFFGYSYVYVIFEDGVDLYWARSRVLEYLSTIRERLPQEAKVQLGPDATGVGWIYEYALVSDRHILSELRSIQDWYLKYELASVKGVAEVASIGGYVKQYQVTLDPIKLLAYNIPITRIKIAIQKSNLDVGGKLLEISETEFMVRARGYINSVKDIENIPVGVDNKGTPILIKDIATVSIGPELRRGISELNGEGEVVGGIIVMRHGENALKTINLVKHKLKELKKGLPEGVKIIPVYDRSGLILRAINTLKDKLLEEMLAVTLVIIIFLVHLRSSFVAVFTLPLGILISFIAMYTLGINANIMSLGGIAIAIGVMVDASVVMVENAHKHLERHKTAGGLLRQNRDQIMINASREVGPALFYSLLIVTLSFLPVFTLQAQEGRLFKPLAYTKTFAMAASSVLSITLIPVLMCLFVRGKIREEKRNPLSRLLIALYMPFIKFVLRFPKTIILLALIVLGITVFPYKRLGSEFMPPLYEGDFLWMPTTDPGISITKAKELLQQTDKILVQFPQVKSVFGKIGKAETATDPAPLSMIETTIALKPESQWPKKKVKRFYSGFPEWMKVPFRYILPEEIPSLTPLELDRQMNNAINFPGLTNATMEGPIKIRLDMLSTGIRAPVGIKVSGQDLQVLEELAIKIANVVKTLPGTVSAYPDKAFGGNYLDIEIDRVESARYGLTIADVQQVITTAIGGMNITQTVEGQERYPVNLRYARELRDNLDKLSRVLVPTPRGEQIPLGQLATLKFKKGPSVIKSENARLSAWVQVSIRDVDLGTYVKRARSAINQHIKLPPGYTIKWSGRYEYMQRAQQRLKIVVPITIFIIFLLLYIHFKSITETLIVLLCIPFALVGGIWYMYFAHYNMSVATAVGFIALAGLAAETGVVMLVYLDMVYNRLKNEGKTNSVIDIYSGIIEGAVMRVRPKIMTVSCIILGLLPIMFGHGTGSEVMKRISAPMLGGMISSTIMTLLIIPAIYLLWKRTLLRLSTRK